MYIEVAFNDPNKKVQNLYIYKEILKTSEVIQTTTYTTIDGYRYGFNGMEKDDEVKSTGNSYDFGARMYDSRLGRWFARDLLANKYPSISPYTFVNNMPVLAIDKDGNDWIITTTIAKDGTRTVFMKLTAAVVNNSSTPVDMNAFSATVKSQVENAFSISYMDSEARMVHKPQSLDRPNLLLPQIDIFKVNVVVQVDIRIIKDNKEVKSTEHLIRIEDNAVATKEAGGQPIGGKVNKLGGTDILIDRSRLDDMMDGTNNNTIPHEVGHTLNLHHVDQKENERGGPVNSQFLKDHSTKHKDNLMTSGKAAYKNRETATQIKGFQVKWIKKSYEKGKINQH